MTASWLVLHQGELGKRFFFSVLLLCSRLVMKVHSNKERRMDGGDKEQVWQ